MLLNVIAMETGSTVGASSDHVTAQTVTRRKIFKAVNVSEEVKTNL